MCYRLTSRIYSIDIGVSLEISFDLLRNESVQEQSKSRLSRSIFAGNSAKTALRDLCSNSSHRSCRIHPCPDRDGIVVIEWDDEKTADNNCDDNRQDKILRIRICSDFLF